jgi:hypothetical protein
MCLCGIVWLLTWALFREIGDIENWFVFCCCTFQQPIFDTDTFKQQNTTLQSQYYTPGRERLKVTCLMFAQS